MPVRMIAERKLPQILVRNNGAAVKNADDWQERRRELIDLLSREEYGYTPAAPTEVKADVEKSEEAFAGKGIQERISLSFDTPGGRFSFPITLIAPAGAQNVPAFVLINFRPDVPDKYLPAEEIIDRGFAVAVLYYNDVTADSGEWNGLAAMYPHDPKTGWGKIGMWAFAASRIMDYLETRPDIDSKRVCVTGHSRLGKTALWCAAQDERFSMAVSNDSGCSGAAISRCKIGEDIRAITDRFPYWFCGNYLSWADREQEAPFDQHMLLSLIAPRKLYVGSAKEDEWADPDSEFLSCVAAGEAWKVFGKTGFVCEDKLPETDVALMDGDVCYHVRKGTHYFSRTDWLFHMACRDRYGV